jgi:hypothetical protein
MRERVLNLIGAPLIIISSPCLSSSTSVDILQYQYWVD